MEVAPPIPPPVWDEPGAATLPRLDGPVEADLCVVGLGVAGLHAARTAARSGWRVVALDAADVGAGASGRNGGFLLAGLADFHHDAVARLGRARATALYRATLDELSATAVECAPAVRLVGSLRIAASAREQADCTTQLEAMRADGLPVGPYDGPEGVGLLFPQDGAMHPLRRTRLLAEAAAREGVRLFGGSRVSDILDGAVVTAGGRVECRATVVAVDGGLEVLLPELVGRVRTARAQMLATAPDRGVSFPRPVYRRWGYDYWQQLPDGTVALGGFRDLGGEHEWTLSTEPGALVQAMLERFLRDDLGVAAPVTHRWAGLTAFTPDRLPVCEAVRPGLVAVGGYCGTGNLVGALAGRAAAALAMGSPAPFALLLHPDRAAEESNS